MTIRIEGEPTRYKGTCPECGTTFTYDASDLSEGVHCEHFWSIGKRVRTLRCPRCYTKLAIG